VDEIVSDGTLIDVRGMDLTRLLADADEPHVKTALDRLLLSSAAGLNGFNNYI
jgi:hypothetical protein